MNPLFSLYVLDTETTGLVSLKHSIIELSILRISDGSQKTWCIKPHRETDIEEEALRINGHKLEDILHRTEEGRLKYLPPSEVVSDIENYMMEDGCAPEQRVMVAQNGAFDIEFLFELWNHCGSRETFPFGKRPFMLDTRQIALFLDYCMDKRETYYNLGSLVQKYGVKKLKSHEASSDTKMTADVFLAQVYQIRKLINK